MNSARPRAPVLYDQIGGEEPLRRMVEHFYDIVETHPDGAPVHRLHLQGFGVAHLRQAQFEFLSGFLGGPRYYVERMGHSNVRQMHAHLAIGPAEVRSWLRCMARAIDMTGIPEAAGAQMMEYFRRVAESLRNRD